MEAHSAKSYGSKTIPPTAMFNSICYTSQSTSMEHSPHPFPLWVVFAFGRSFPHPVIFSLSDGRVLAAQGPQQNNPKTKTTTKLPLPTLLPASPPPEDFIRPRLTFCVGFTGVPPILFFFGPPSHTSANGSLLTRRCAHFVANPITNYLHGPTYSAFRTGSRFPVYNSPSTIAPIRHSLPHSLCQTKDLLSNMFHFA